MANGEKKFWTIQKKVFWIATTVTTIGAMFIMLNPYCCTILAKPAIDKHVKCFPELHAPLIDSLKEIKKVVEKIIRRVDTTVLIQSEQGYMYLAQFSRAQRKLIRERAKEIRTEDSLNRLITGGH